MEPLPIILDNYAPDLDPMGAGRMISMASMVPTLKGWAGAPSVRSQGLDALAAACRGSSRLVKIDNSARIFAGTTAKLYELSGTSWTDRTRAAGGDYSLGTIRWSFAQFGDASFAAAKSDILQATTSGAFANAGANAPKATVVETVGNFVLLFDCNDQAGLGPYGDNQQRWWCSPIGLYGDWTPSIAAQCATATLTSTPGPIRGARRFGTTVIAYKERSMFQGVYVGQPQIWDFREIPGEGGACSNDAIANIGTPENPMHISMGVDDFFIYDGTRALSIGHGIRGEVFTELDRTNAVHAQALADPQNQRVYFFYPVSGGTTPDKCVVYNYRTGKWGRSDRTIESILTFATPSTTYDSLGAAYSTYSDLPTQPYDQAFATTAPTVAAVFDTTHTPKTLDGTSTGGSFSLGDIGNTQQNLMLSRVIPKWLTRPSGADMTNSYRMNTGDNLTVDQVTPMDSRGRFDVFREARWHRLAFSFSGPVELAALDAQGTAGGEE